MAAVAHLNTTVDTTDGTSFASGSFTPTANDLLVVFVAAQGTVAAAPTMTDSQGLGFTRITSFLWNVSTARLYLFVADALAAASSMTVTFDCTGDDATNCQIVVAGVSGMTAVGSTAVVQSSGQANGGIAATPAPVFAGSCVTTNPTLGAVADTRNPAAETPPTSWTELADTGVETAGLEYVKRASGFTGTTITWGAAANNRWASLIVELDAGGAAATPPLIRPVVVSQAVQRAASR